MSRKRSFIILCILCLFVAGLVLFIHLYESQSKQKEQSNPYRLEAGEIALLQEGDLIFRKGFGIIRDCIARTTQVCYNISHVGVLCKDAQHRWMVIHTVSNTLVNVDGMQIDELAHFVRQSYPNTIVVLRYRHGSDSSRAAIVRQAYHYLDRQIPFDDTFDMQDTSEFFCTEFIRKLFLDVYKKDLYELASDHPYASLRFGPFWNADNFSTVFAHQEKQTR